MNKGDAIFLITFIVIAVGVFGFLTWFIMWVDAREEERIEAYNSTEVDIQCLANAIDADRDKKITLKEIDIFKKFCAIENEV